ncbi:hypothetical protein ES288_A07G242200v1 [Gossypium darwinii]|uniref:3-hydroxyisobutyrate dehydrogenase n=3 Tax=Gossypium TaxID=3633 RepID=A0A5D2G1E8_GOSDA|nr:hypothetical protein ES288_A07G242200v1 [Gossypium darwinii]
MAIGSCCNVIEEKGCELCCVNYTRVPSSNTRSLMLLLLICGGENWENPVMLDAPVSRGVVAAEAGSLTFMVGGSEDVYLAAKSLLLSMGKEELQEAIDFISLFG